MFAIDEIKNKALLESAINDSYNCSLLGLGGSYSYGLAGETSDIDIRGVLRPVKRNILLGTKEKGISFKIVEQKIDISLSPFAQMIKNMANCNPSAVELLGLKTEHYLFLDDIGKEILDNKQLFVSKKCLNSFLGYAERQKKDFVSNRGRVKKAFDHNKISKHMYNTLRLLGMCYDILLEGDFITYRERDRDFLLEIKNGKFLKGNSLPSEEFFSIMEALENDVIDAARVSKIPDKPNMEKIENFIIEVNERVIKQG